MDQLRTLLAVHETGTALGAARLLGREQSSVQKQLDTMNRNFAPCAENHSSSSAAAAGMCSSPPPGRACVELARGTLRGWQEELHDCRRRLGGRLSVGSTRYTLGFLLDAVELVTEDFGRRASS